MESQRSENAPPPILGLKHNNLIQQSIDNFNFMPNMNNIIKNLLNKNKTKIGISYKELKELKNEYLIELIQFINYVCNLNIQNKYIGCMYSIFKIVKNKATKMYHIKINKKEERYQDAKNNQMNNIIIEDKNNNEENIEKNCIINENDELINEETYFCEKHSRLFNNLEQYYNHCKNNDEALICEKCLKGFKGINRYRTHKCNDIKVKDHEKDYQINDDSDLDNIECPECELTFDSVESMSLHYFEIHEKKKQEILKKREEKRRKKEEEIKKKNLRKKEIDERLAERMRQIIELDKNKKSDKLVVKNEIKKEIVKFNDVNNDEQKIERKKEREEVLKKQQDIIIEELFKRKNEKINQRLINREEEKKREKK